MLKQSEHKSPEFLIFLDFDGVTHPLPSYVPSSINELKNTGLYRSGPYFCKDNILQINRLTHKLNANVVITSTWRLDFGWLPFNKLFVGRVIGQTPELGFQSRYQEGLQFISKNNYQNISWLALDDNSSLYPTEAPVYITDGNIGITAEEVNKLLVQYRR
ncbi:MAG: HAD domain-containing protein [Candidatus Thiodiazotropha taylori]|nr:HAD domain-containing protein [Candidatus Thiodiazotropha taylori]